jgi:hypothetical protein
MKEDGSFDKEATVKSFDEIKDLDAELHGKILKVIDACEAKSMFLVLSRFQLIFMGCSASF